MRILARLPIRLSKSHFHKGKVNPRDQVFQSLIEAFCLDLIVRETRMNLTDTIGNSLLVYLSSLISRLETDGESESSHKAFDKSFAYPRSHKEVESRDGLPSMLLILIGLEYNRSQCGVALDTLWSTNTAVLGKETTLVEILEVVLYASCCLGRIIVKVVDMNIANLMSARVDVGNKIFACIVFSHLGGKSHHLPGGGICTHIGIAQVGIVLFDLDNTIHGVLQARTLITLYRTPLTIDNILLGNKGVGCHKSLFHHILYIFYG